MASFGKIYSYPNSWRVERAQIAAAFNGLDVSYAADFTMQQTNKSPDYAAKFPMCKVPAFEGADGFCLSESPAIARYLAASGPKAAQLLGPDSDPKARAVIDQWCFFAELELTAHANPVSYMTVFKFVPLDQAAVDRATANFARGLAVVEGRLAESGGKTLLGGEEVTMADIMVSTALIFPLGTVFGDEVRAAAPKTLEWLKQLSETPEFKVVSNWGKIKA